MEYSAAAILVRSAALWRWFFFSSSSRDGLVLAAPAALAGAIPMLSNSRRRAVSRNWATYRPSAMNFVAKAAYSVLSSSDPVGSGHSSAVPPSGLDARSCAISVRMVALSGGSVTSFPLPKLQYRVIVLTPHRSKSVIPATGIPLKSTIFSSSAFSKAYDAGLATQSAMLGGPHARSVAPPSAAARPTRPCAERRSRRAIVYAIAAPRDRRRRRPTFSGAAGENPSILVSIDESDSSTTI